MFHIRKKKYINIKIILDTIDFDADDDKLLITFRDGACLSPEQVEEISDIFNDISNKDSIIVPDVIKEITVLKKYGKKK